MNEVRKIQITGPCTKIGGRGTTTFVDVDGVRYLIPACLLWALRVSPAGKIVICNVLLIGGVGLVTRISVV